MNGLITKWFFFSFQDFAHIFQYFYFSLSIRLKKIKISCFKNIVGSIENIFKKNYHFKLLSKQKSKSEFGVFYGRKCKQLQFRFLI